MHEGDFLKQWIKKNRSSPTKLAEQLGMAKSSIYYQLDLEQLSASFIDKLKSKGIAILNTSFILLFTQFINNIPKPNYYQKHYSN